MQRRRPEQGLEVVEAQPSEPLPLLRRGRAVPADAQGARLGAGSAVDGDQPGLDASGPVQGHHVAEPAVVAVEDDEAVLVDQVEVHGRTKGGHARSVPGGGDGANVGAAEQNADEDLVGRGLEVIYENAAVRIYRVAFDGA